MPQTELTQPEVDNLFCRIIILEKQKKQVLLIIKENSDDSEDCYWYLEILIDCVNVRVSAMQGKFKTQDEAREFMLEFTEERGNRLFEQFNKMLGR